MTVGTSQDEAWYRRFIALAILFRTTQKTVREEKFSAYQANIVAYTVASLAWVTAQRIDFDLIWSGQVLSGELVVVIRAWSHEIDRALRTTAGARMPTEWAKRVEAWEQIRAQLPSLTDPLPPELAGNTAGDSLRLGASSERLSAADLHLIEQCRAIPAENLLEIVTWGHGNGVQKWQLAILNTVTGYAASGWERSPSAKQARWVLDAKSRFDQAAAVAD